MAKEKTREELDEIEKEALSVLGDVKKQRAALQKREKQERKGRRKRKLTEVCCAKFSSRRPPSLVTLLEAFRTFHPVNTTVQSPLYDHIALLTHHRLAFTGDIRRSTELEESPAMTSRFASKV